ncbi:hypothetical protein GCM10008018_49010 [Paenibacillus marchantiophytorum]|uniref:DUF975 family protein n=1 Tax=Paenibacillus marchantiophytorum TaxID=1619310 RepID=A0ABQ1F274_9BACL|nr:hypothetical protein [Paenibacillus marchantiophytorum]GFZ96824.1 hypothetical protein GCM10008018_49010 [Paenibacillus marchantiophytorum]
MTSYLKSGLRAAFAQPFATIILFVYQMGWSILLYKLVQGVLVPLMHRFPGGQQPKEALQVFLAESQFQLMKTDLSHSYLWWLGALLALRMLLTPVLSSGVYYSLTHSEQNAGYRFFRGIKVLTLPFLLAYITRIALTLLPLIWLLPKAQTTLAHSTSYEQAALQLLPWFIGMLVYGFLFHLLFMYVQFALAGHLGVLSTVITFIRYSFPIVGLALLLLLSSGLLAGLTITATYLWAGLVALIIYQLFPLFHIFLQIWAITSQFKLLSAKLNG